MKTIATLVATAALAAPAAAQACKPAVHVPTQVTVRAKRAASGPFCAPTFRTVRLAVRVEGRRVVITIRVPRKRALPYPTLQVIR